MVDKIKYNQVLGLAQEIVNANPNMVNPQGLNGECVYSKLPGFDDTINVANRCIGGEILSRLDLSIPHEGTTVYESPDRYKLTTRAMQFLAELQRMADYRDPSTRTPRPWGKALEIAISAFAEYDAHLEDE